MKYWTLSSQPTRCRQEAAELRDGSLGIRCSTRSGTSCRSSAGIGSSRRSLLLRSDLTVRSDRLRSTRSSAISPAIWLSATRLVMHTASSSSRMPGRRACSSSGEEGDPRWSPRFEHGYSQIIDWFHKLDDMRSSDDLVMRFGSRTPSFSGARDRSGPPSEGRERERLVWRRSNVVVSSRQIECVTLDELADDLQARLAIYP